MQEKKRESEKKKGRANSVIFIQAFSLGFSFLRLYDELKYYFHRLFVNRI
jgi:hypothetical protein